MPLQCGSEQGPIELATVPGCGLVPSSARPASAPRLLIHNLIARIIEAAAEVVHDASPPTAGTDRQ